MLGSLTLRNSRLRPDAAAILFEGRTITHRVFAERALRLAAALRRRGVARGDRVAILAQNCPEYLEAYAAGELGGWTSMTVNYRLARSRDRRHPRRQRAQGDDRGRRVPRPVEPGCIGPARSCSGHRRRLVRRGLRRGAGRGRTRAPACRARTGRLRLPDLHQRHHREAQGRHAEPPRDDGGRTPYRP